MFIEFDSLGDLNDDVTGKYHGHGPVDSEEGACIPDLWDNVGARTFGLIPYTDHQEIINVDQPVAKTEEQLCKDIKILLSIGKPITEVVQFINNHCNDTKILPNLNKCINDWCCLRGYIYVDLSSFKSCDELRKILKENKVRYPEFIIGTDQCKKCQFQWEYGRCTKIGLIVVDKVDQSFANLKEQAERLAGFGLLSAINNINSWADLKSALFKKNVYFPTPVYKKESSKLPRIFCEKQIQKRAQLNALAAELTSQNIFYNREIRPILQFTQLQINKGKNGDLLKELLQKKAIPTKTLAACSEQLKRLLTNPLIESRVAFDISLYDSCADVRKVIEYEKIVTEYVYEKPDCKDCIYKKEQYCSLLNKTILFYNDQVPQERIVQLISEIAFVKKIEPGILKSFIKNEEQEYLTGLTAVLRYSPIKYTTGFHADINGYRHTINEKTDYLPWVTKGISKAIPLSNLAAELGSFLSSKRIEELINIALYSAGVISADVLSNCVSKKYNFSPASLLIKTKKCEYCPHAQMTLCGRLGLHFTQECCSISPDDTDESIEFKTTFATGEIDVSYDNNVKKPKIDVSFLTTEYADDFFSTPNKNIEIDLTNTTEIQKDEDDFNDLINNWNLGDTI